MSIIGTFNGWNIISMPSSPAWRQLDFSAFDSVGIVQSPFTLQTQTQYWVGADHWTVNASLPPMSYTNARAWVAFLLECRGRLNVFSIGDPLGKKPSGSPTGTPVVSTNYNLVTSTSLLTRGWRASTNRLLLPGDYIQIGYRLHAVVDPVNSDSSGNATINLWPSLRDTTTDGQAITLTNTTGLFRLASNQRDFTFRETKTVGLSFKCEECR
jgi:hypothetical protein